jgi:hypothetical protein
VILKLIPGLLHDAINAVAGAAREPPGVKIGRTEPARDPKGALTVESQDEAHQVRRIAATGFLPRTPVGCSIHFSPPKNGGTRSTVVGR